MQIKKAFQKEKTISSQKVKLHQNNVTKQIEIQPSSLFTGWSWGCSCDAYDPNSLNSDDD